MFLEDFQDTVVPQETKNKSTKTEIVKTFSSSLSLSVPLDQIGARRVHSRKTRMSLQFR